MTTGYIYRPLDPEREEVRLLYPNFSGPSDEPLDYRIEHVSLLHGINLVFNAISYTWEQSPKPTSTILLDGKLSYVPPSAESALRGIANVAGQHSPSEQDVPIWIDAICINQADVEEKSAQLPLMSNIYSQATTVVIWLRGADGQADDAFVWVESF